MSKFRPKVQFLDLVTAHQRCLRLFFAAFHGFIILSSNDYFKWLFFIFNKLSDLKLIPKTLVIMDPFRQKKFTNFRRVQFLEGLTKWYLPWSNFKEEIFNNKTYISLAVLGGQYLESPWVNFLGEFMNYILT